MGRMDLDDMEETSDNRGKALWSALLRVIRPALPAVIGAAALTFLFAAVMPMSWVAGIGWNLYLDRLSDFFVPPVGNAGRLVLALGMAAIAAGLAGIVALLIATPEVAGLSSLRNRFHRRADVDGDGGEELLARRRRIDVHPDDAPRPPIRAGRDLPAGGLGPLNDANAHEPAAPDPWVTAPEPEAEAGELVLADLAPDDAVQAGYEPWLQPAELAGPVMPDPTDNSLGAMVARFEAGLVRRRQEPAATAAIPVPGSAAATAEPDVDFALEAALSTLQRMTRQSVG